VLGTAAIAVLIQSRLTAHGISSTGRSGPSGRLPAALQDGFSSAMGEALLLPAAVLVLGLVAALCFARPAHMRRVVPPPAEAVPAGVG
jgi:hypothetical protein